MQAQHTNRGLPIVAGVVWGTGVLLALPVVALRYPPMGDLPMHEALVSLMRHFGDAALVPPGVYRLNLGPPNQLFHWLAWLLSLAVPTDLACKLVIAAAIVATPLAAMRLAHHAGTSAWTAMLVAPLALGFAFRWGLVGNVLALPTVLASLPVLDRFVRRPSAHGAMACAGLMVLAYATHESALLALAVAAATLTVAEVHGSRGPARDIMLRAAPVATAVALAAFYALWGRHLKAPSILAVPDAFGAGPLSRVLDVPGVLFGNVEPAMRYGACAMVATAAFVFAVTRRKGGERLGTRLAAVGGAWAALYLVMPLAFGGSTVLYQRFLPLSLAVLFVVMGPAARSPMRPLLPLLATAQPVAALLLGLPAFGVADRAFRDLDPVIARVAPCSAVAQLDLTPRAATPVAPVPGAAARALAVRGGRLLFSFTDAPTAPVTVPPAHQWNEPVLRMVRDPVEFRPAHDFRRFRYALVRLAQEYTLLAPVITAVMAPEGKLVGESGEWLLFESTLPVDPIDSPDAPLPVPPQESLRERLAALRERAPLQAQ